MIDKSAEILNQELQTRATVGANFCRVRRRPEGETDKALLFGHAKSKADKMEEVNGRETLSETVRTILGLAEQRGVRYTPAATDAWAQDVTRLAGDDVVLDDIELLLIALQRAGHLSRPEALRLQVNYLRESRP